MSVDHDRITVAIARRLHTHHCGTTDGHRDVAPIPWAKVDDRHRHRDCVQIENLRLYASEAGYALVRRKDQP